MNKLLKAALIGGGIVTVGAVSYLYGLVALITDLKESSETAYNIYTYDVKHRPITTINDAVMRLNVNAQDLVDQIVD